MNGNWGYFITREEVARGGYERDIAMAYSAYYLDEKVDDFLVAENLRRLWEMRA